jgi:hypothetical protein
MEHLDAPGLFCIGECLDVTGRLGGYNLQGPGPRATPRPRPREAGSNGAEKNGRPKGGRFV